MFEKIQLYKLRILLGLGSLVAVAAPASAAVNWTNISDLVESVATDLFPAFITLIENAVPIIVVIAVVGFIVAFMDKILGMIKV